MPIPLGILAAAGVRPAAGGSYELIETYTVGASNISNVTFNVSSYASTYQHLQIRGSLRTQAQSNITFIRFNNDSGSNYSFHWIQANGNGSVGSYGEANYTSVFQYSAAANNEASGYFSALVADILDPYETTKNKTIRTAFGRPGNVYPEVGLTSGLWRNTTAINSVSLLCNATNWAIGTRFSIYGLKAS